MFTLDDITDDIKASYVAMRVLPDGRVCGVHKLIFHWTMHVGITPCGYEERYCYRTRELAEASMENWSGEGDPDNWHKHPDTGRLRDSFGQITFERGFG